MSTSSPIPMYHLIASAILRRIDDGDYEVGAALPTEEKLSAEFQVSRTTIRQAMGELVNAGMLSRRRGSGTFVLPAARTRIGQRFQGSLADLMAEIQRTGVKDVTLERHVPIPNRIAAVLGLNDAMGTTVKRVRTIDGMPFAYTVNYLPDGYGQMLTRDELEVQPLMSLLDAHGVKLTGARQSIRAQLADFELTESLQLPYLGAPVLFVERVVTTRGKKPVQVVHTWYRSDLYEYTVTFEFSGRSGAGDMDKLA